MCLIRELASTPSLLMSRLDKNVRFQRRWGTVADAGRKHTDESKRTETAGGAGAGQAWRAHAGYGGGGDGPDPSPGPAGGGGGLAFVGGRGGGSGPRRGA